MRSIKKIIAIILIVTLMFTDAITAFAALESSESVIIQNGFIQATTNSGNGRFSIKTIEGSPYRDKDQEAALLFNDKEPETSFTTFRINGKDYIYGNNYGFAGHEGSFINQPNNSNLLSQSIWRIGDFEISQQIELKENIENPQVGNAKITYKVSNKGASTSQIGARILLDTMIGSNDGAPVLLPGDDIPVRTEKEFSGDQVPAYWRALDISSKPEVVGYGLIEIPSRQKPDRVILSHWNAISKTKWDYEVVPKRQFSSIYNEFSSADSAVALYWNPTEIKPGETKAFETYYGLGELSPGQEGDFNINISAPDKLSVGNGDYLEKQFTITAEIDNTLSKSEVLRLLKLSLELPEGLKLAEGETKEKTIEYIPKNTIAKAEWKVVPTAADKLRVVETEVRIYSDVVKERSKSRFIILPGVGGELPEVYYQGFVPKLLYGQDERKSIHIMGKGFSLLTDLTKWDFCLENQQTGEKYYVPDDFITIVDDTHIAAMIPSPLAVGRYALRIEHETYGKYSFNTELGVSNDSSLASRDYDLLTISIDGSGNHVVKMLDSETESNKNAALIIRGKVREITKDQAYEIIPDDTATINSTVKYKGSSLQVYKEGNVFNIKGDGILRLNTKIAGNKLDVKIFDGKFILDSGSLTFKPQSGYAQKQDVEKVGVLPLVIKSTRLDGEDGVYIDADMQLPIKRLDKLFPSSYSFLPEALLKDMHFNSDGVVYTGEVDIPFPSWKIGSFESTKNEVTLCINTKTNSYGIKANMMNRPLKLMDIDTALMFKDWVPDYIEFENDYGKIPKPIGSTGLGLQKIGGGMYGIYKLWEDKYPSTTIKATCDIIDLVSPKINGNKLINGKDLTATIGISGIDITGDGYIYSVDVGDLEGKFIYDTGGYLKTDLNLADILIAEAYVSITKDFAEGYLNGKICFPNYIPFVGGEKLAGFSAGLSTKKIWGSTEFLKCDVSVTYWWEDNDFDFDLDLNIFGRSNDRVYAAKDKGLYVIKTTAPDGKKETVVYGSNMEKVETKTLYAYAGQRLIKSMAALQKQHAININNIETALIKVDYDTSVPSLKVRKPDGSLYELRPKTEGETDPNCINQVISAKDSKTGKEEKSIFIVITDPVNGDWSIESDIEVEATLYNVKKAPKFKSFRVEQGEYGSFQANWDLTAYKNTNLSFYLVKDGQPDMSIPIIENVEANIKNCNLFMPDDVKTGKYYILAKAEREDFGCDTAVCGPYEIFDPMAPQAPKGFYVEAIGNGKFRANWDYPDYYIPYGYYIEPVDENGNPDPSAGEGFFCNSGEEFGGVTEDASGKAYGWLTNREYRFALSEYSITYERTEKGDPIAHYHYSKPAISNKVFLPEPKPPEINVKLTSPDGNIKETKDIDGIQTKIVNGGILQLDITLDKEGCLELRSDTGYKLAEGKQNSISVSLNEGINNIEIKATSKNGDMSIKNYKIISDTSAPYLMVESPLRSQIIDGDTLTVSGRTEAGALITIEGQETAAQADGSFSMELELSGEMNRAIDIKSQDMAGNISSYEGEVWRGSVGEITGVIIKPVEVELENGSQKQLELFFKTSDGNELRIDPAAAEWEVIGNLDTASVSDSGLLYGRAVGKAIVKASYKIGEGFALEDAIPINIIPKKDMPPQKPDDPEEPIENPDDDEHEENDRDENERHNNKDSKEVKVNSNDITVVEIPGKIRIEIPKDTLSDGSYITVKEVLDADNTESDGMTPASSIFEVEIVGDNNKLKKEVKMIIYYDDKVEDINKLGVYRYNEETDEWELAGGKAQKDKQVVTLCTDHFSTYAVFENSKLIVMRDMLNHWVKDAVNRLILKGAVSGIPMEDGNFKYNPDGLITRAEFAKLLAAVKGFKINESAAEFENTFADWDKVPSWAKTYISYCYTNGWIDGIELKDGRHIISDRNITRAEAAAMLGRTLTKHQFHDYDFIDKDTIPKWAEKDIKILSNLNIIKGCSDNSFKPNAYMTRAEAAALFDNYLHSIK